MEVVDVRPRAMWIGRPAKRKPIASWARNPAARSGQIPAEDAEEGRRGANRPARDFSFASLSVLGGRHAAEARAVPAVRHAMSIPTRS